jgi:hypothetical protein
MNTRHRTVASLLIALTQACASSSSQMQRSALDVSKEPEVVQSATARNAVSGADLTKTSASNLFDALRQIRPEFLRSSTRTSALSPAREISVFENERYLGGINQLSMIPLGVVVELRRLEPVEAKSVFGSNCPCDAGVIHVRTSKP